MPVVKLRGPLKQRAGEQDEHEVAGATIGAALTELERAQPALAGWILEAGCQVIEGQGRVCFRIDHPRTTLAVPYPLPCHRH